MRGNPITAQTRTEMLAWLRETAARGEPSPKNGAIAKQFGFSIPTAVRLIQLLEAEGLVVVDRGGASRTVRIAASAVMPPPLPGKPRVSAAVIRAAKLDGRDLPAFVTALINMGLDCWRDDRLASGEAVT